MSGKESGVFGGVIMSGDLGSKSSSFVGNFGSTVTTSISVSSSEMKNTSLSYLNSEN